MLYFGNAGAVGSVYPPPSFVICLFVFRQVGWSLLAIIVVASYTANLTQVGQGNQSVVSNYSSHHWTPVSSPRSPSPPLL